MLAPQGRFGVRPTVKQGLHWGGQGYGNTNLSEASQQAKSGGVRMGKPSRPVTGTESERFRLEGKSHSFDPRIEAIRPDLADVELASRHFAPHYAAAVLRNCTVARTPVRAKPDDAAEMISELLYGEGFALLDITGGWAWGYSLHDHYVGYVHADTLDVRIEPAHRVIAPVTINDDVILPIGALLTGEIEGNVLNGTFGEVPAASVIPIMEIAADPVATVEPLEGTPYLWGGRSNEGIDCSGLVQLMLARAGIDAPRDSDLQLAGLSGDFSASTSYQRGDILFFVDHVGLMLDENRLLHATQHYGKVVIEPLEDVVARLESEGQKPAIIGRKRLL